MQQFEIQLRVRREAREGERANGIGAVTKQVTRICTKDEGFVRILSLFSYCRGVTNSLIHKRAPVFCAYVIDIIRKLLKVLSIYFFLLGGCAREYD